MTPSEETVRSGMLDMFVFAYRLDTRVLSVLAARPSLQEILSEVLTRALDRSIARKQGFHSLPVQRDSTLLEALTVREQDAI